MIAPINPPAELSDANIARLKTLVGVQKGLLMLSLAGILVIFCALGAIGLVMYYRIALRNLRGDLLVNRVFDSVSRLDKQTLKNLAKESGSRGLVARLLRYEWVQWMPYGAAALQIVLLYLVLPYLRTYLS